VTERIETVLERGGGEGTLTLAPAMRSTALPEWQGARWVGTLDLGRLGLHDRVVLQDSEGYGRARLLVRDGAAVRGFIDVETPQGVLERPVLDEALAELPALMVKNRRFPMPPITVIVCTRNRASQLRGALEALRDLDYPDFDVLVVDNAPRTTETLDMVRREFSDPRITLVQEPVPGLSQARNTGLRMARGGIVAFTDDDVVVDKAWLVEIAAGFAQAPDAACVTGLVPAGEVRSRAQEYFNERVSWSKVVVPTVYSLADPPADLPKFPFSPGAFGTGANFALDREVATRLGGFDTALGAGTRTGGGEDIDMFTRVILAGYSLVVQPSAIGWHRHRDGLEELRSQAGSYGRGLGAWLTKILLNPRTAHLALRRAPGVAWSALRNTPVSRPGHPGKDEWDAVLADVLRLELFSIALGPLHYLLERLSVPKMQR
jgi:GT2 family glycosyltransferase